MKPILYKHLIQQTITKDWYFYIVYELDEKQKIKQRLWEFDSLQDAKLFIDLTTD